MVRAGRQPRSDLSSRWVTLVADFVTWLFSLFLAAVFRFEFEVGRLTADKLFLFSVFIAAVFSLAGFVTHLYRNRFVYGSLDELRALLVSTSAVVLVGGTLAVFFGSSFDVPRSIVFLASPIFLLLAGSLRLMLRQTRLAARRSAGNGSRAVIFGAGVAAEALIPQLLDSPDSRYKPVALIDDSPEKSNRWISGIPMAGKWNDLEAVVEKFAVEVVIVAIPSASSALLDQVYEKSWELGLKVIVLPGLPEYLRGSRHSASELRNVGIEDLLGRPQISLDTDLVDQLIRGKRVLITGAGGSIGAELARQVAQFGPGALTLVDRDETGLLLCSMEIQRLFGAVGHETYLLDIRDTQAVSDLFSTRKPEIVFHAAALKHLSMLEQFPTEAWKTNVEGTLNVLEAAEASLVQVFANISTDKAANAKSTLGRSKKLGEQVTSWFGAETSRRFVSVRFGNVLGSRGSLIPILSEQIAAGGPVTITDERATRYFMSISEACQLVLQAAVQGVQGDVMVLDMGEPVLIKEIARKMIQLAGTQTEIKVTGLRPGEKLHEDLLSDRESWIPSGHPKILRVKSAPISPREVMALKW